MKLLITFIILNAINVVLQTVKSLLTIKGNKIVAALANGIAYGLYTIVIVYTVCDLSLFSKVIVIGGCNFIGVYAVKWIEEKMNKDKLWKVEATITSEIDKNNLLADIQAKNIKHYNFIDIQNGAYIFNFFCETQNDSLQIKELLKNYNVKYFVSESKIL